MSADRRHRRRGGTSARSPTSVSRTTSITRLSRGGAADSIRPRWRPPSRRRAAPSTVLDVWRGKAGGRTLAFCVTVSHAEFMADFFRNHGVAAVAVHSGPGSAPRTASVERLRAGELHLICTVDVFNEGLDVPEVDTVLMLRPTDSPVVFMQQLGRGLRRSVGKESLTVIDFIGNHRSFLIKPRTLLTLAIGGQGNVLGTAKVLRAMRTGDFGLPNRVFSQLRRRVGRHPAFGGPCWSPICAGGLLPLVR